MGTAVAMVLGTGLFMNWYYHRKIGLDMLRFWRELLKNIPALIIMCLFGVIWSYFVTVQTWGHLAFSVAVYTLVYFTVMWILALNDYEKSLIKRMITKILNIIMH